jgi:tetratricopeptide (TPR) repeat protein
VQDGRLAPGRPMRDPVERSLFTSRGNICHAFRAESVVTIRSIMCSRNKITFGAAILMLLLGIARIASADGGEQQVCNVRADYALGVEDYSKAIRLHTDEIRKHPDNALAHYHLGFAEGMMGNRKAEVSEYQRSAALGLKNWDLFLNIGLAQLEIGELDAATDSLRQAVLLGENHAESHFNLALAYEQRGMHADAERETLASLRLNPRQPDARNLLGVIDAQTGQTVRASLVWRELVNDVPDYEPARTNLALLGSPNEVAHSETAAVVPPPAAAVTAIEDQRKLPAPQERETELVPVAADQMEGE